MQLPIPATSAFQGYLDKWIPDQVRQEARQIAISAADEKKVRRRRDSGIGKEARQQERNQPPLEGDEDDDEDWPQGKTMSHGERMLLSTASQDDDADVHMKKRPPQDDTPTSRKRKSVPRPEPVRTGSSSGSDDYIAPEGSEFHPLIIGDEDAVTTFYMTRLRQMQQLMCKVVAKAWIKVIEPKKQSNFPYNRGNESKPAWWPENVRHKEPDHLMKPERLELLLTMLRCGKVPISKLVTATQEVMVQIPKERIPLLDEIYMVADREERCKAGALSPSTAVYVASSAEKIISRPAASKERSPEARRQSIASPTRSNHSGPGSTVAHTDRRMSVHSPTHSDMASVNEGREIDIRVPSRMGSRDESSMQHSQPSHNPFSGSNTAVDTGYTASYAHPSPIVTSPIQDQQPFMNDLPMRSPMGGYYSMGLEQQQPPILRRNNTMPPIPSPGHHPWGTQIGMYPFSPSSTPNHTPYGPNTRQSASNPPTPVTGGPFTGLQLPPPPPHPQGSHQSHQSGQQTTLGHRPSHHSIGQAGEGGSHQYDPPGGHMGTQIGGNGHQNLSGFTEFLRSDLATDDGNGRGGKME
ncbi:hypothetical protein K440DRAFT_6127 [Wilcoxina mikolae CBS 423.85]|nr:hypothetical protein K440DRAFT_6127 [Wilcoxina mikolae CBS 423.85]